METAVEEQNTETFVAGDTVRIQLAEEVFKPLQEGHGGWNDSMTEVSKSV